MMTVKPTKAGRCQRCRNFSLTTISDVRCVLCDAFVAHAMRFRYCVLKTSEKHSAFVLNSRLALNAVGRVRQSREPFRVKRVATARAYAICSFIQASQCRFNLCQEILRVAPQRQIEIAANDIAGIIGKMIANTILVRLSLIFDSERVDIANQRSSLFFQARPEIYECLFTYHTTPP